MEFKHKGTYAELRAQIWLLEQGYEVFSNVSDHGVADLVIRDKNGALYGVDVTTGQWRDTQQGPKLYHKALKDPSVRYLVATGSDFTWVTRLTPTRQAARKPKAEPQKPSVPSRKG